MKGFCLNFNCFRRRRCDCSDSEEEAAHPSPVAPVADTLAADAPAPSALEAAAALALIPTRSYSSQSTISLVDVVRPKSTRRASPKLTYPEKAADKAPKPPKAKPLKALKPLKPGKSPSSTRKITWANTPTKASETSSSSLDLSQLPPPRIGSHTDITPEMSDMDLSSPEQSDLEWEDAERPSQVIPPEQLLNQPLESLLVFPTLPVNPMIPLPRRKTTGKVIDSESESDSSDGGHLYIGSARPRQALKSSVGTQPSGSKKRAYVEEPEPSAENVEESEPSNKSIEDSEPSAKRPRLLDSGHTEHLTEQEMMELGKSWPALPWGSLPWGPKGRRGPVLPRGKAPKGPWGAWPSLGPTLPFAAGPVLDAPKLMKSPEASVSSDAGSFNTFDQLYIKPSVAEVAEYRRKGAQLQAWLEDPNEPGCNIAPITTTLDDLMNAAPPDRFEVSDSSFVNPQDIMDGGEPSTVGLIPTGCYYRRTTIDNKVTNPAILAAAGHKHLNNGYSHLCGPDLLVANSIFRYDNVQWNVVARAVYTLDRGMETLKFIMFSHVVNNETQPYILQELYPRLGLVFDDTYHGPLVKVERGSREFEELLGTKLGKAAAILLISSLPRGTRRIARAVIWNSLYRVQVRFEIESAIPGEEIPGDPVPRPGPAPTAKETNVYFDVSEYREPAGAPRSPTESDDYQGSEHWDE
ncbi:uncharacterized protein N7500_007836 [Penicillium coprophilum]|uniref:uncharacterized protein n=1 Tax=Penicillium coprophilum TaxID=36646 RepID=UPI00239C7C4F|nr:uncharacterized protein N7500_007836 [Penicillium coprophilum]KAJ5158185.1 hypothetical protein N7500_007836 [Penicillium coprophilum]